MRWQILINNFLGGFAPAWYKESYPSYGNKNQAGTMQNIDLTNPGFMTQGPGLANLTNGTQAGAVTTLIKGATDYAVTSGVAYGVGGAKLYKFSSSTVTSDGTWPHAIDKGAVTGEDGEDVILYQGNLYYSYNHSGSAGDIGKYDLSSSFDDDWGSTVPSGAAALTNNPHPMALGGNDTFAFGNGRYLGTYDGTTLQTQALDLPTGYVVVDVQWNQDRWWITANNNNISGSNKNGASIFVWDGTATSWEVEIKLMGTAGGSHVKNGVLFQFYQDVTSTGGYKLGYVNGSGITDVANYTGGLPAYYQITDYKDFIIWNSNGLIFAFGAGDKDLPVRLFQYADGGHATVGCVVCPFGTPIIASYDGASAYRLAQFSGYDTACNWKSLMFDVTGSGKNPGSIDRVKINFETLATGASVAWKLLDNQGRTVYSDTISYAKATATTPLHTLTTAYYPLNNKVAENFRVEFDFTNGSATNPVKIKNVKLTGDTE